MKWNFFCTLRQKIAMMACLFAALSSPVYAYSEIDEIIDNSTHAFGRFLASEDLQYVQDFMKEAKGIIIIPNMIKVGFFGGVEHGKGMLFVRQPNQGGNTEWSTPLFYEMNTGSIGLQFGVQSNDLVLMIMNDAGLDSILNNSIKLGSDLSLSAWTLGAGIELATDETFSADIIAFTKPVGFFGGVSLKGSWVYSLKEFNQTIYNTSDPKVILQRGHVPAKSLNRLYLLLNRF